MILNLTTPQTFLYELYFKSLHNNPVKLEIVKVVITWWRHFYVLVTSSLCERVEAPPAQRVHAAVWSVWNKWFNPNLIWPNATVAFTVSCLSFPAHILLTVLPLSRCFLFRLRYLDLNTGPQLPNPSQGKSRLILCSLSRRHGVEAPTNQWTQR